MQRKKLDSFKEYINQACKVGNLSMLTKFLDEYKTHFKSKVIHNYAFTKGFEFAIYNGHLNIVQYLLTSSELKNHVDIHHNSDYAIRLSCHRGHLDIVQFLLTSPLLEEKANPLVNDSEPFRWAAEGNHLSVIQFLLDNDFQIDPHYISPVTDSSAFMMACDQNAIESVKYISQLSQFDMEKSLCSINQDNKDGFQLACENHECDSDIVEYLIIELGFKPNKRQQKYIEDNIEHEVVAYASRLLKSKAFHEQLDNDVSNKNSKHSKLKI